MALCLVLAGGAASQQAIGRNRLGDYRDTDYAAIRAEFERIVALPDIGTQAGLGLQRQGRD